MLPATGWAREAGGSVSARYQIRTAVVTAILVVLASFALLFALSVIGKEEPASRSPITGAPISFPTQEQDTGGATPTRTPAAIPTGDERR